MIARWVAAAALLGGCIDDLGPGVGPPLRASCSDEDSDPTTTVDFTADVFVGILAEKSRCTKCHTPGGSTPFGFEASGFDVSRYATLVAGGARSGAAIVVPGSPCSSILMFKLGENPPFGSRMPLDGPFLSDIQVQLVSDWIAEGALE